MEVKFENRYYGTNKMIYEYSWKVLCRRLIIMGMIYMIASAVFWYFSYINSFTTSMEIFMLVFIVELCIVAITPPLTARQLIENSKKIHNGKEYESIIKFSDKIYMREGAFSLDIEYSQIIRIYYLKHSCALMFGKRNAVIIDMNKFSIGSSDEFKGFIKKECVNLKKIIGT